MAVLEAIAAEPTGMRIQTLAERLDLTPGAIHHILDTLAEGGYVERRTRPVTYHLGPAVQALAERGRQCQTDAAVDRELQRLARVLPRIKAVYCEAVGMEFRMRRQAGDTGVVAVDASLPPYTSAASLVHFAFWPSERVEDYQAERPFTTHGIALWQNRERFDAAVAAVRARGFADLPMDAASRPRIGVPVLRGDGVLVGSFTLTAGPGTPTATRDDLIREGLAATASIRSET